MPQNQESYFWEIFYKVVHAVSPSMPIENSEKNWFSSIFEDIVDDKVTLSKNKLKSAAFSKENSNHPP